MQDIHVYERLPAPAASDDSSVWGDTARFYLIGLGGRGQKALQELGAWEPVTRRSVVVTCPLCRKRARGSRGDTPLVK